MATVTSAADPDGRFAQPLMDPGALAVALAHGIAAAARADVLIADGDAWGTRLAQRISTACRIELLPARRGLPTLIAARDAIRAHGIEQHCWVLPPRQPDPSGRVLLAAAATHPDGAASTARWLGNHAAAFAELHAAHRRIAAVLVPLPGPPAAPYGALEAAASASVHAVARPGTAPPGGLRGVLAAFGLSSLPDPVTEIRSDGEAVSVIGPVRDSALLGARPRRAEHGPLDALRAAGARLGLIGRQR